MGVKNKWAPLKYNGYYYEGYEISSCGKIKNLSNGNVRPLQKGGSFMLFKGRGGVNLLVDKALEHSFPIIAPLEKGWAYLCYLDIEYQDYQINELGEVKHSFRKEEVSTFKGEGENDFIHIISKKEPGKRQSKQTISVERALYYTFGIEEYIAPIWKAAYLGKEHLEGYEVSNLGVVRKIETKKQIAASNSIGYKTVSIKMGNSWNNIRVHRIVASTFLAPPEDFGVAVINHINFDKTDNRLKNLEWTTSVKNTSHYFKGVKRQGGSEQYFPKNLFQTYNLLVKDTFGISLKKFIENFGSDRVLEIVRGDNPMGGMHELNIQLQEECGRTT